MERVPVSWPDLVPGWPLCWTRTSTSQHPQSFGVQWMFPNMCADVARVWRCLVPAARRWIPVSQPPLRHRLPKPQELQGRGFVGHALKSLCAPIVLSILEVIWVMVSSMMRRQIQLPLQKGFAFANELFLSKVPSPSCSFSSYIRERESSHISHTGHPGWDLAPG